MAFLSIQYHRLWKLAGVASSLLLWSGVATSAATPSKAKQANKSVKPAVVAAVPKGALHYNQDIRPILAENCFACHGPDSAARKAGLRLDRFEDAINPQTGPAIVPHKVADSWVVKRITGQGPLMPPPGGGRKPLTAAQIATLKKWIADGAQYEKHWAYITPKRPALPAVKNAKWARNPIDRFVLAKLEQQGLAPAPEADRRTLARRVSFDLTGLPPLPADVNAFVNDKAPDAYEKYVDKMLSNPQWGEHRTRYWLDAARYADSNGIHIDNYREMWTYREWVINAFNRNEPFDKFTIDQIAGDLVPNHTVEQQVATGFNRCNITTSEGGAIDDEYAVLYARDRVETTSAVFLGSTLGCAVCHDHKFDPFSQKDFYSMTAYFNNSTEPIMDGNVSDTPPILRLPVEADKARFAALPAELDAANKTIVARKQTARAEFDKWLSQAGAHTITGGMPTQGLVFHAPLSEGKGRMVAVQEGAKTATLTAAADPGWDTGYVSAAAYQRKPGSTLESATAGDFERNQSFSCAAWVKIPQADTNGSIVARMDDSSAFRGWDMWLQNGHLGMHIISNWPKDALKVVTNDTLSPGVWHHLCVTYGGGSNIDSMHLYIDGVPRAVNMEANSLQNSIRATVPFKIGQRNASSGVDGVSIQDVRLYNRALPDADVAQLKQASRSEWLASKGAALAGAEREEFFDSWLTTKDTMYKPLAEKLASLQAEDGAIRSRMTVAHVMQEKPTEAKAYVLFRGDYDKRRDEVKAALPASLPALPPGAPNNRLGYAEWLVAPNQPLMARVTVNRFWQEVFGQGLVRTTSDFGVNGEMPSHPELLDWMAVEFREKGWDVKKFFKMIVMSATYRQSALTTPEKRFKDPQNRWLSHGPRFRMDAEMVRDCALATSGLLVPKIGGPSVKPYQPKGVWEAVAMPGSNTHDYMPDKGENLYRRSMYTFWKRSAPPASMDIFNAPTREQCTVRRERTDTPLQALVTLNDTQFIEAARVLATNALKTGGATDKARIDFMAQRLLSRSFRPEEQAIVIKSLNALGAYYAAHSKEAMALIAVGDSKAPADLKPERLAAWTMLANQLMNLDEVLNK